MFELNKIGVYHNINRPTYNSIVRVSSIGMESMRFVHPSIVNEAFKKVNVIVLVQEGNCVITEDNILPHTVVTEIDLEAANHTYSATAITEAAAIRAARNAGVTIARDSLKLVAVAENTDVYYLYTAKVGTKLHDLVEKTQLISLTREAFLNQCTISELI